MRRSITRRVIFKFRDHLHGVRLHICQRNEKLIDPVVLSLQSASPTTVAETRLGVEALLVTSTVSMTQLLPRAFAAIPRNQDNVVHTSYQHERPS